MLVFRMMKPWETWKCTADMSLVGAFPLPLHDPGSPVFPSFSPFLPPLLSHPTTLKTHKLREYPKKENVLRTWSHNLDYFHVLPWYRQLPKASHKGSAFDHSCAENRLWQTYHHLFPTIYKISLSSLGEHDCLALIFGIREHRTPSHWVALLDKPVTMFF